jgi:hypothetical protein
MSSLRSFGVVVKEARELLDELATFDPTALTEGEVTEAIVATHGAATVASAVHTSLVGQLDVRRSFEADGALSAGAWVAWRCGVSRPEAQATVRCSRVLRHMPAVSVAFLAGRLTADHVRRLAKAQSVAPDEFAAHEAALVEMAVTLRYQSFEAAIRYWCHLANPERAEKDAETLFESRHAHGSATLDGMVAVDALLDPVGGQIYLGELRRIEDELFEADWADARARLGEHATKDDLRRTPAQRRCDAMVEMARRSAAKPADAKEARTLLTILAGEETLKWICELSNGTVLTPGGVLRRLDHVDVERVVFGGPSRVLDVGVRQRLFTGATRRAVEVRDRQCVHPSCDEPAERCQVDHVIPYERDGPTIQDNGRCYCKRHHRWHHRQQPQPPP